MAERRTVRGASLLGTYECSQFRTEFAADSPLEEGEGFEPSVPRKRHNALRDCPFRFLGTLLDQPTFRLETCATLETARRLGVGTIISSTLDIHSQDAR
jgi:hypothetical protein